MAQETKKKTTIDLPESLHLKAKRKALDQEMTLKSYINRLILADLMHEKEDKLTS